MAGLVKTWNRYTRFVKLQDSKNLQWYRIQLWECPHVLKIFEKDLPPPWGIGYDASWPPGCDPCWGWIVAPLFERLSGNPTYDNILKKWSQNHRIPLDLLQNMLAWSEMRGYIKCEDRVWILTLEGERWALSQGRLWRVVKEQEQRRLETIAKLRKESRRL